MVRDVSRIARLRDLGQSVWLDVISREMLTTGSLRGLVADGVAGVTTNPSIIHHAVSSGTSYDDDIGRLAREGLKAEAILDRLWIDDVRGACDVLRPVYDATRGADGYVSIEVKPSLAYDSEGTIAEARRLWDAVARANVMVKIPGTRAGLPAIRRSLADGLNINVTLMFSMAHYEAVVEAFLAGLEDRLRAGESPAHSASVASFFVSRVDNIVDDTIDAMVAEGVPDGRRASLLALKGLLAVANSRLVYGRFMELFGGERWAHLATAGATVQRLLWASTSTKNPAYDDLLYVDTLIGRHTVNTMPPATLEAFLDHGSVRETVSEDLAGAAVLFERAAELGLDIAALTERLQTDGVAAFATSYDALVSLLDEKCRRLTA